MWTWGGGGQGGGSFGALATGGEQGCLGVVDEREGGLDVPDLGG